jgi:hypothetical protein
LDFSPIGATWDTTAGTPNVTFSNGNLTATKTTNNAFVSVRSTKYKLTGKWYAEKVAFSNGSTNNVGVGVGRGSFLLNLYAGQSAPSVGIRNNGFGDNDGVSWVSGAADLTIPDGTWTFIALDADTSRVWFKKQGGTNWNNSGTANPATGVGGLLLSGAGAIYLLGTLFGNTPGDTGTVNFGATAFIGTVPSGFTAWGS